MLVTMFQMCLIQPVRSQPASVAAAPRTKSTSAPISRRVG